MKKSTTQSSGKTLETIALKWFEQQLLEGAKLKAYNDEVEKCRREGRPLPPSPYKTIYL